MWTFEVSPVDVLTVSLFANGIKQRIFVASSLVTVSVVDIAGTCSLAGPVINRTDLKIIHDFTGTNP
jgi:hypothetical protein